MKRQGFIYLLTNSSNNVFYVGVTSNLIKRAYEHREKVIEGFSKRYNLNKLVYYEVFDLIEDAILREKQIKAGSRLKKIQLIESMNPSYKDLYNEL
jgi:putative endonuclease